jgi:phosphoribosylformylglycinamidine synthase
MKPRALIAHASGTNRDRDVAWALEIAGAVPDIVHINTLRDGHKSLLDYQMLVLPGGFSYGDDLGAGKLWAVALRHRLGEDLEDFVARRRPILGICNGFQALVKSGLLPAMNGSTDQQTTLTRNVSGRFECRWVQLEPNPESSSGWIKGLTEPIECPVAHGEGRFVADAATLESIEQQGLVGLRYMVPEQGDPYPANPNGSANRIAGITNPAGNILGLMPHPENHIVPEQHPTTHRGDTAGIGLPLFRNGVDYAAQM